MVPLHRSTEYGSRYVISSRTSVWNTIPEYFQLGGGSVSTLVSPVLRGLTELFMVVEIVAKKWGVLDEITALIATRVSWQRCFIKVRSTPLYMLKVLYVYVDRV